MFGVQQLCRNVALAAKAGWQKHRLPDRTRLFLNTKKREGHRWIYSVFRASPDFWLLPPERVTSASFPKLIHPAAASGLNH
ncbi:hypothetical protein J2045_004247 [Peteryoungia aggregata LMG 23059]|uniref:Transposase n=1 Tax=Peteryoungia aggregata LMG 23059 TaxID=1368425 RepID=A0ABU0GCW6_9HYPH|nr:hypothetical protein [Peteryoungia aggregata]MDQ0423195.1 hypothetical protein [Peteryoungia aggregata LMG 23059]